MLLQTECYKWKTYIFWSFLVTLSFHIIPPQSRAPGERAWDKRTDSVNSLTINSHLVTKKAKPQQLSFDALLSKADVIALCILTALGLVISMWKVNTLSFTHATVHSLHTHRSNNTCRGPELRIQSGNSKRRGTACGFHENDFVDFSFQNHVNVFRRCAFVSAWVTKI